MLILSYKVRVEEHIIRHFAQLLTIIQLVNEREFIGVAWVKSNDLSDRVSQFDNRYNLELVV